MGTHFFIFFYENKIIYTSFFTLLFNKELSSYDKFIYVHNNHPKKSHPNLFVLN